MQVFRVFSRQQRLFVCIQLVLGGLPLRPDYQLYAHVHNNSDYTPPIPLPVLAVDEFVVSYHPHTPKHR